MARNLLELLNDKVLVFDDHILVKYRAYRSLRISFSEVKALSTHRFAGFLRKGGPLGFRPLTLALFGPTDPDLWKPPGPWVAAVRAANPPEDPRGPECGWMENLDVDTVWRTWSRLPNRCDQEEV